MAEETLPTTGSSPGSDACGHRRRWMKQEATGTGAERSLVHELQNGWNKLRWKVNSSRSKFGS